MTTKLLWHENEAVGKWVVEQFDGYFKSTADFSPFESVGVVMDGKAVAAGVFHQFHELPHGNAIEVIWCSTTPKWANRGVIREVLAYPFIQLKCGRLTTRIAANNIRSRRFNEGLGFRREGEIRRGYDGKTNLCIYGLLREEAERWLSYTDATPNKVAA